VIVGILNINKPVRWTSHDVVARVRRLAGEQRVGHAGTLDPLASGVLPVLLGRATRLADFIHTYSKTYVAEVALGTATSTDDAEGSVIEERPVPSNVDVEAVLPRFVGDILQVPPAYSAIKVAGQRAYAVARRGGAVTLSARSVTIHDLRLVSSDPLTLEVTCGTGTYIRSLARDIAHALGTVGHLKSLVRTRVGPFTLATAATLETVDVQAALLPPEAALPEAPSLSLSAEQAARVINGQSIAAGGLHADPVRVYDPQGRLVCLGRADGDRLYPRLML
jgi:tRNA pseudouridine55 synthase